MAYSDTEPSFERSPSISARINTTIVHELPAGDGIAHAQTVPGTEVCRARVYRALSATNAAGPSRQTVFACWVNPDRRTVPLEPH
jgi:hypothetical protein